MNDFSEKNRLQDKSIEITFEQFVQIFSVIEKVHYVLHRCEMRENMDVRAYALAIAAAEMGLSQEINKVRSRMRELLNKGQDDLLIDLLEQWEPPMLPSDQCKYEELQKLLKPYMVQVVPYSQYTDSAMLD